MRDEGLAANIRRSPEHNCYPHARAIQLPMGLCALRARVAYFKGPEPIVGTIAVAYREAGFHVDEEVE
jgi:hypothetical protein